jgi:hypothetical protein
MSVRDLKKISMRYFFDLKNHAVEMSICDLKSHAGEMSLCNLINHA